jgi:hypothetical protein
MATKVRTLVALVWQPDVYGTQFEPRREVFCYSDRRAPHPQPPPETASAGVEGSQLISSQVCRYNMVLL